MTPFQEHIEMLCLSKRIKKNNVFKFIEFYLQKFIIGYYIMIIISYIN